MQDSQEIVGCARELLRAAGRLLDAIGAPEPEPERPQVPALRRMAVAAGLPDKPYYTLTEVAQATGIPRSTLDDERKSGELRSFVPPGQQRGCLVKCEWYDEWFDKGTAGGR